MNQAVVENKWELCSHDVSTAFLQGLTFKEMQEMGFTNHREVCLDIPKNSLQIFSLLPGMSDFDPERHVLRMLKGGFGLKDAPRMWRIRLGQELEKFGMKPLQADKSIYCKWREVGAEHFELTLILSTHVDDLKGGGRPEEVTALINQLEKSFGKGKLPKGKDGSEHCGVIHKQNDDYSVATHQNQ